MVARDGRSIGEALSVVTAAEAPFVQVPSHINVRDGQITLINNDHTLLGLQGVGLSDALPAGEIPAAAAAAERLVYPVPGSTSGTSCSPNIPAATPR